MESKASASTDNGGNDEVFFMNIIEENGINEDMLCNSIGCA